MFDTITKKLGEQYKNDFNSIATDNKYNNEKLFNNSAIVDLDSYNQFASELLIYYFMKRFAKSVKHDCIIRNGSKKDVDIVADCFDDSSYKLNIEIKTPKKIINDSHEIKLVQEHRLSEGVIDFSCIAKKLKRAICKSGNSELKINERGAIKDNPLKSQFDKSFEKFNNPTRNEINILFICVDNETFCHFVDYIHNVDTGLYSKKPYFNLSDYKSIEYFIISNCCEAHIKKHDFNCWNLANYENMVFANNSIEIDENKYLFVSRVFNDINPKYLKFFQKNAYEIGVPSHFVNCLSFLDREGWK